MGSARLAWRSMNKLGNVASATVTDMIGMAWDELSTGDEAIVIGMGPGFVLDGVCLRMVSEDEVKAIRTRSTVRGRGLSPWTAIVVGGVAFATMAGVRSML